MGQYYRAVNLAKKEYISSWSFKQGSKLMEHSWLKNEFVNTVENMLAMGQPWYKTSVIWAGDYGDLADKTWADNIIELKPLVSEHFYRYLLNHSKKCFVDKTKVPDNDGWSIHPLPLLTADGNGRGGGDFGNDDPYELIGSWMGDKISVSDLCPDEDWTEIYFNLSEN